ncbi:ATP-binding protein [Candidatus Bathyarchaeota archaeon]|nr:ATP-binding protein [Candidatus Bathyarchaeota archaeon]
MVGTQILLGFEVDTGEEVYMNLHHTVITGMTQLSGKTTTLEALISRSEKQAIAFKTKRGEGGFNNYNEIQPFFNQRADWQYVSSILEAVLREKMRFERPWIMRATKDTKSLREVLENIQQLRSESNPTTLAENIYTALEEYLKIVVPQIEKFEFSKKLTLNPGINVMDLTLMSVELQSLVIQSTMEYVINKLQDTIIIIPEAWEHLPQGRNTPVKLYAETFIRKGASIGNYLFIDSQDIAGIDKTPLRQCNNWILGRQREGHEVERVREQLGKSKITAEDIRTLPIGHFYAILGDDIKKVYVLPAGVPQELGKKIAKGEIDSSEVKKFLSNPEDKEKIVEPSGLDQILQASEDTNLKRIEDLELKLIKIEKEVSLLRSDFESVIKDFKKINLKIEEINKYQEIGEKRDNIKIITEETSFGIDEVNLLVDQRVHQILKYDKPTILVSTDVSGAFKKVIKEEIVHQMASHIRALPKSPILAAMIIHEKQNMKRGELYSLLYSGKGKRMDDFYRDIEVLEESKIIIYNKETGIIKWGLRDYIDKELDKLYDENTINEIENYLTSLLLPTNN